MKKLLCAFFLGTLLLSVCVMTVGLYIALECMDKMALYAFVGGFFGCMISCVMYAWLEDKVEL